MELQASSCASGSKGYCNPAVGGWYITNDYDAQNCTIGLAVEREVKDW